VAEPFQSPTAPLEIKMREAPIILTLGDAGSGKTTSILTQLKHPEIEHVFVLGTEPRFLESLLHMAEKWKIDTSRLHYAHIYPMNPDWNELEKLFKGITIRDYAAITKAVYPREGYDHILDLIDLLGNFKCECCEKEWGPVDEFDDRQFFNVDSLTGLAKLAKDAAVGSKPVLHEGEWGVAMSALEVIISKLAHSCRCFVSLTGHLDREVNLITGGTHVTALTIGKKLTPKLLPYFSEIVLAYRDGDQFLWSTTELQHTLKARILPIKPDLKPDFTPLIDAFFKSNPESNPKSNQEQAA
jgi:hypothetical protein